MRIQTRFSDDGRTILIFIIVITVVVVFVVNEMIIKIENFHQFTTNVLDSVGRVRARCRGAASVCQGEREVDGGHLTRGEARALRIAVLLLALLLLSCI